MIGRLFTISQSVKNGSISQRRGQTSDLHGLAPYGRKSNCQGKLDSSSGREPTISAERNALQSGPDDSPPGRARPDNDFYETPEGAANQPPAASRYQNRQVNHCGWPACLPFLRSMAYGISDNLCSPSLNTPQRQQSFPVWRELERTGRFPNLLSHHSKALIRLQAFNQRAALSLFRSASQESQRCTGVKRALQPRGTRVAAPWNARCSPVQR